MADQSERDYLTGLYDRRWLFEDCPALEGGGQFRILYFDLDNFKTVNDLYGHEEGDRVLRCVSEVLLKASPEGYPIRMSGDEFVLLIPGEKDREALSLIYSKIISGIVARREAIPGLSAISVSAGVVRSEEANGNLKEALQLADDTMYEAKHAGKGRCVFFEDIREKVETEKGIADEAPEAVKEDRFVFRCVPLLNLQNGILEQTLVTALWNRKNGQVLEPSEYRPVLENNGFIRVLDRYLLEKMLKMIWEYSWAKKAEKKTRFSLEISALHFLDGRFEKRLRDLFKQYSVDPELIDFAVTERAFSVRDTEQLVKGMEEMAKLGVSLSLKNYGSTFASIRYLNLLPVSSVRFDRSWLLSGVQKPQERKLIKSVIRLTKDAHKKIVAIGELSSEDRRFLSACGCDAAGSYSDSTLFEPEKYFHYIKDKLPKSGGMIFDFDGSLDDRDHRFQGEIRGGGITYEAGVTDLRGAIRFPGGAILENVIEYPSALFSGNSYTIALWVNPEKETNWSSVIYMRYEGGFTSFVPYTNADDGISVFRISVDDEGFFDTTSRAVQINAWNHLCFAYDAASESLRYYINGRRAHFHMNKPLQIGCRQVLLGGDPFQRSYEGLVSSLIIYDYALSDGEIESLYREYCQEPGFLGSQEDYWMDTK